MLAFDASSDVLMVGSIGGYSQIANVPASPNIRNPSDDLHGLFSHHANMDSEYDLDDDDKNGGPNHLRAWMQFRKVRGAKLAKELGITPGMVSDLANSNRALSAKWLRRIAPALSTTPGLLLDHDPYDLDSDIIQIWVAAGLRERKQIAEMAKVIVGTGTDG